MLNTILEQLYKYAKIDKRIVFIGTDNAPGMLNEMKESLPNQFFMEGASEQNIIGMASGMAADGLIPYVFNHATFNTRRVYEQVLVDCALQNRHIRIIGIGGGVATCHLGPTHTSIEDIGLMRLIPRMTVLSASDKKQLTEIFPQTINYPGSIYIRIGKYGLPNLDSACKAEIKLPQIYTGNTDKVYEKILVLSHGAIFRRVYESVQRLNNEYENRFILLNIHTIKPLNNKYLKPLLESALGVMIIEEHILTGGLSSAIGELLISKNVSLKNVKSISLGNDNYIHNFGKQEEIWDKHYLSVQSIYEAGSKLIQDGQKENL